MFGNLPAITGWPVHLKAKIPKLMAPSKMALCNSFVI